MSQLTVALLFSYEPVFQLERCLESLKADLKDLPFPENEVQWILIRTPKSVGKDCSFFEGETVWAETENLASNRNKALSSARSDMLYFIDPDCWIQAGTLRKLIQSRKQFFANSEIYAFAGPNSLRSGNQKMENLLQWLGRTKFLNGGLSQISISKADRFDWHSPTCNILYDLRKIDKQRYSTEFDNVGEDLEFHFRMSRTGKKIHIRADAPVWHEQPPNFSGYLHKVFRYGTAQTRLLRSDINSFSNRRLWILFGAFFWILVLGLMSEEARINFATGSFIALTVFVFSEVANYRGEKDPIFFSGSYLLILFVYLAGQVSGLLTPLPKIRNEEPKKARI